VEEVLAEAGALDALEELLGDDLVGVDVGAVERDATPVMTVNGSIRRRSSADVDEVAGDGGGRGHLPG
jgi:hypothetical protein